jgi:hypothetical protein
MLGSFKRVQAVLAGQKPDRIPFFDMLHNDAVLTRFHGRPVEPGDEAGAEHAVVEAVDATHGGGFSPRHPKDYTNAYGIQVKQTRWTTWKSNRKYASAAEYAASQRAEFAASPADAVVDVAGSESYRGFRALFDRVGSSLYLPLDGPVSPLMACYGALGIEAFSYYLADEPVIFSEILENQTVYACRWAEGLPKDDPFPAVMLCDDLAFKSGTIVSPEWLRREYFPRLTRLIAAFKRRGKRVIFHSDGNLNAVVDDLVAAGIDGLNPIETASGMDLADLHRRHPKLVLIGGIPVTDVLAIGTPDTVRDAVVRAIEDTEGRLLVGSDSEIANSVPLANFLALREAVLTYAV